MCTGISVLRISTPEEYAARNSAEAAAVTEQQTGTETTPEETAAEAQKTASTGETGNAIVMPGPSALNNPDNSLGKTLYESVPEIQSMEAVKQLSGTEMNDRAKKPSEQIADFFKRIGNRITRRGLGDVILDDYGISSEINHRPLNRAKMVTIEAVPEVIANGKVIKDTENWKGRGYRSIVIAAPVRIADSTVYVAAVVNQHQDNKFYLHEVIDSDGNYIRIETDETGTPKSRVTVGDGITTVPETSVSENSVAQQTAGSQETNAGKSRYEALQLPKVEQAATQPAEDLKLPAVPGTEAQQTVAQLPTPEQFAEQRNGAAKPLWVQNS